MKSLPILIVVILSCISLRAQTARPSLSKEDSTLLARRQDSITRLYHRDENKMKFSIQPAKAGMQSADNLMLTLEFKNISDEDLRLFDCFGKTELLNTSLSLIMVCKTGPGPNNIKEFAPLSPPITDFNNEGVLKYIIIPKGKSIKKTINLSSILKERLNMVLVPGTYLVWTEFHNEPRRKDFMKGYFKAPDMTIMVN